MEKIESKKRVKISRKKEKVEVMAPVTVKGLVEVTVPSAFKYLRGGVGLGLRWNEMGWI